MRIKKIILSIGFMTLNCACAVAGYAQTTPKKVVATAADLPRFSYPVTGDTQQLLNLPAHDFTTFAVPIRRDIDATLRDYDIQDHAALRGLLQAKLNLAIIAGGEDKAALEIIQQIRSLQDKPDAKLTSNLMPEAFLRARIAGANADSTGCPAAFPEILGAMVQGLPFGTVAPAIKNEQMFAGLISTSFIEGYVDSDVGPMIASQHALSLSGAENLLEGRARTIFQLACKQPSLEVLNAYIKKNDVVRPDIWAAREAVLPPVSKLTPVNVGIWDSGFDTSLFPGRLFIDPTADPRDRNGIAFDVYDHPTHGELIPLTPQQMKDAPASIARMQAMGDIEGGVDSPAANAFKQKLSTLTPQQMRNLFDEQAITVGYSHGTGVASVAAQGNPAIRLAYVRITYDNGSPHMPPTDQLQQDTAKSYAASVQWFRDHHIRVVNMSWWDRPSNFEKDLADNGIGKDEAERKKLARHYFEIERDALYNALKSAPEILFVTIAGNSNQNNAFEEDIPSSFRLPNLIVTGAVDQAGEETSFTTYGDNVAIDANGNAVPSLVPGGTTVRMSGTSIAAPQVTNLAAKLLAINPNLTPTQVIALIVNGADTSADGRRHLMNPRRSIELMSEGLGGSADAGRNPRF